MNKGFIVMVKNVKDFLRKAIKLAQQAEVVVLFLGLDEYSETEGLDRQSLNLPVNQLKLLEEISFVNPNIIVVLSCGSVVDLSFDVKVKGLVHGYLLGQAGATAIMNVLNGSLSPSGKLAETYPIHYKDTPTAPYFPG